MTKYIVKSTPFVEKKLDRYISYLVNNLHNEQAAQNVFDDYVETRHELESVAGAIQDPDNEALKKRKLKRINFQRHNYFMLFRVKETTVEIITMFHGLEDYERKLDKEDRRG